MKYLLLQYGNETEMLSHPKEEAGQLHGVYLANSEAMKKAGAYASTKGLRPTSDAALVWAKRHPFAAYGAIEVRPVWG